MRYIIRKKRGRGHIYYDSETKKEIKNKDVLNYVKSLVIPPAWRDTVIVYPTIKKNNGNKTNNTTNTKYVVNSKRLAVGYDEAGRLQSIYSNKSIKQREKKKVNTLIDLANNIDTINGRINRDLNSKKMSKNKLIALIIKIIMRCNFRVGKEIYKIKYNSTGITTITPKNIKLYPKYLNINFIGKKGVFNQCDIKDRRIVDMIKSLYKLTKKNENIFSYIDPDTKKKIVIDENDVNEYLKQFGENITSKNFRTYNANMYYINIITNKTIPETITARKRLSNDIIKQVSKELHHTSAICKKSYLNNDLIDTYINSPNKFNTYFIKNKNKNTNKNSNKYSNKNNFIRFLVANN